MAENKSTAEYNSLITVLEDFVVSRLEDLAQVMGWEGDDLKNLLEHNKELRKKTTVKGVKKHNKNPLEPKRYCSAYIYFSTEQRPKIKAANPEADTQTIMKLLGDAWKALKASDKAADKKLVAKFQKKSDEAKAAYEVAMAAFKESNGAAAEVAAE
jgi:hypothetical protein